MKRKGFTLIEVLMGLCLLGLISVMILPIIGNSSRLSSKNSEKIEMAYVGEMIIENLKAYTSDVDFTSEICNTEVKEIINQFELEKSSNIKFDYVGDYEKYKVIMEKNEKSSSLWEVLITISYIKEGDTKNVKYKALIPVQEGFYSN